MVNHLKLYSLLLQHYQVKVSLSKLHNTVRTILRYSGKYPKIPELATIQFCQF